MKKYKVDNAIILAAGRGSRLKELTDNTPKPLLAPRGKIFIEDIIEKLIEKKIKNVIVVVGYLAEKFDYLKLKYGVKIIHNENWNKGNNITSILAAKDHLKNSLIINGDIILKENIFINEYKHSLTYCTKEKNIDEWIIETKNGQVINFDKNGIDKEGFYQREIIFITEDISNNISKEMNNVNIDEYQEFFIINISNKYNIPFGMYEVKPGTIFDLDNIKEFKKYSKNK
ncbi:MAG: NTP transferase domain-containing protein [Mycoplasma sp.]|nr:NTP transferase domain-containing protein [Mycoplasma sp.]